MLAYDTQTQQVFTESFDGPLELLLYLVRRQGVDIRTVKIASITDSYLQHIRLMQELRLDVAGDFLFLASSLCYLKSRELLPGLEREAFEDEDEDPTLIRERLSQQLIEYERYKEASLFLSKRPMVNRDTFLKEPDQEEQELIATTDIDSIGLLQLYRQILEKYELPDPEHHIKRSGFSLHEMVLLILDKLENGVTTVRGLLNGFGVKSDKIVCFLTFLEMSKHQLFNIYQFDHLGEISVHRTYTERPDLSTILPEEIG